MNREEAFKILEARILELLSRISHLEEENARLQKDLSSKAAQLQLRKQRSILPPNSSMSNSNVLKPLKTDTGTPDFYALHDSDSKFKATILRAGLH